MASQNYYEKKNEQLAKRRRSTLKKAGIDNNAGVTYDLQMEHFYEKYGKNKNKWTKSERKLYNDIQKGFLNSGQSTIKEIKEQHKQTFGDTGESIEEMSQDVDDLELLNDDILREELGSETLKQTFHEGEINGYSTKEMRDNMTEFVVEMRKQQAQEMREYGEVRTTMSMFSVDEIKDAILANIEYERGL